MTYIIFSLPPYPQMSTTVFGNLPRNMPISYMDKILASTQQLTTLFPLLNQTGHTNLGMLAQFILTI
jgi:hypothetical protein